MMVNHEAQHVKVERFATVVNNTLNAFTCIDDGHDAVFAFDAMTLRAVFAWENRDVVLLARSSHSLDGLHVVSVLNDVDGIGLVKLRRFLETHNVSTNTIGLFVNAVLLTFGI